MIVPADGDAIVMRRRLAQAGLVTVAVDPQGGIQVEAVGLPLDADRASFLEETRRDVESALAASRKARADFDKRREAVRLAARRAASRWTGKKPQVIVMLAAES